MSNFIDWWQHLPEKMNPVVFSIGNFSIQYYGLMYLVAFAIAYILALRRIRAEDEFDMGKEELQGLITAIILGVLIGGRLGYVLFYNLAYYIRHPLTIILPFSFANGFQFTGIAGMSYHGGLIGAILGVFIFARRRRYDFFILTDLMIPCVPLGYTFGRLGNFINGELYGRVTSANIGMYFPDSLDGLLRHPSQLYEAFFEGIFLFCVLWLIKGKVRTRGALLAYYLMGYGVVRFVIEFVREPDAHLGFILLGLSMGQVLCVLMILAGFILLILLRHRIRK